MILYTRVIGQGETKLVPSKLQTYRLAVTLWEGAPHTGEVGRYTYWCNSFFPERLLWQGFVSQCFRVLGSQNSKGRPDTLETEDRISFSKPEHIPGNFRFWEKWVSFSSNTSFYRSRDSQEHMELKSKLHKYKYYIKSILIYILVILCSWRKN